MELLPWAKLSNRGRGRGGSGGVPIQTTTETDTSKAELSFVNVFLFEVDLSKAFVIGMGCDPYKMY